MGTSGSEPPREREPYRMLCPTCRGTGFVRAARAGVDPDGDGVTVIHPQECHTCDGTGWTNPGQRPPV